MDVLKPKIDDGTLKVVSGQTDFNQVVTQGWKAENAQKRMDTLLAGNYTKEDLDGVLSPNDTLARASSTSVKSAGKDIPVVTGQDSEVESVKSIMAGEQYSTINKDTRNLVAASIDMINALQSGGTAEGHRREAVQQRRQGGPGQPAGAGHRDQGERQGGLRQRPDPRAVDPGLIAHVIEKGRPCGPALLSCPLRSDEAPS